MYQHAPIPPTAVSLPSRLACHGAAGAAGALLAHPPEQQPSVLLENHGHRSAGQIAADVQARAGMNLSIVHRNLDELCRLDVIDRTRPRRLAAYGRDYMTSGGAAAAGGCGLIPR